MKLAAWLNPILTPFQLTYFQNVISHPYSSIPSGPYNWWIGATKSSRWRWRWRWRGLLILSPYTTLRRCLWKGHRGYGFQVARGSENMKCNHRLLFECPHQTVLTSEAGNGELKATRKLSLVKHLTFTSLKLCFINSNREFLQEITQFFKKSKTNKHTNKNRNKLFFQQKILV